MKLLRIRGILTILLSFVALSALVAIGWNAGIRSVRSEDGCSGAEETPNPEAVRPLTKSWEKAIPLQRVPEGLATLRAADCGVCHEEVYAEWRGSVHAKALADLQFQAEWKKDGYLFVCRNCHTPLQNQQETVVTGLIAGDYHRPAEDNHTLKREEVLSKKECFVIESVPKSERSAEWSRKISWIDKESFIPLKEEYYDKRGDLWKVFTADEVEDVQGLPTIMKRTMKNVQRGHKTEVTFEAAKYNLSLPEDLFSERSLRSAPMQWIK